MLSLLVSMKIVSVCTTAPILACFIYILSTKKYMEEFDEPDFFEDNSYKTNSKDVKT